MPVTTEAYVSRGNSCHGPLFDLETVQLADLAEFEILVEPISVAICHSDIRAAQGSFMQKPPMVAGHECAGVVKDIGSRVTYVKSGDSVVLSYSSCMACPHCLEGRSPYCDKIFQYNWLGRRLDGSHTITGSDGEPLNGLFFGQSSLSRLVVAHEASAVKVDATLEELKLFAPLGCGIQTGAGTVINIAKPTTESSILVFGAGAVGISCLLAASLSKAAHLILVDISAEKLSLPATNVATHKILSQRDAPVHIEDEVRRITGGKGADIVIDAVGSGQVLKDGHDALATCGTIITIGGHATDEPKFTIAQHLRKGATYRATHQGDSVSREFIPYLIKLWREGKFPFDQMLTTFSFEKLGDALEQMEAGKVIKPVLLF